MFLFAMKLVLGEDMLDWDDKIEIMGKMYKSDYTKVERNCDDNSNEKVVHLHVIVGGYSSGVNTWNTYIKKGGSWIKKTIAHYGHN